MGSLQKEETDHDPFPPPSLLALLVRTLLTLALPAAVLAQAPPCTRSTCTVKLASVYSRVVVDGCGEHATPGRMTLTLSSTASGATRRSFPSALGRISAQYDFRGASNPFSNWEWRTEAINDNQWQDVGFIDNRTTFINFAGGQLGENIIEVRPKAGAHIWTNRNPSDPMQGPGQLVIPVLSGDTFHSQYTSRGSAYFLFVGGKGCARVNAWGETDGSVQ